jgi:hypothetical protein
MRKTSQRWAAPLCLLLGLGLLIQSTFQPPETSWEVRLGPALVALGFALIFWGLLTAQNILLLISAVRGKTPPEKGEN